jgi:hypothetical protein
LYIAFPEFSNYNTTLNVIFSLAGFYYPSVLRPDTYTDLFKQSLAAPSPDGVILKKIADAFFDTASFCPLVYATAIYIQTLNVMDSKITQFGSMVVAMDYSGVWLKK